MAGTALARQLREAAIPELDQYRYGKIVSEAGKTETIALTKSNVYEQILKGTEALDEASVPLVGRYIVVTPQVYSLMKQSQNFMLDSEIAQEMRLKGVVSIFDGMPVIKVPTSLLPSNVQAIIGHPVAVTSPIKLAEYKINDTPQGISGSLVEGRLYYDAFVLNNKKKALYVITSA